MKWTYPCVLVLAIASLGAGAEIADVRTLDDLRALAPMDAAGGWQVRVGLSDAGPAAGPVLVLYCVRTTGAATQPTTHIADDGAFGEIIGPLRYEVVSVNKQAKQVRKLMMVQRSDTSLFAATIRLEPTGQWKIVVQDTAGNPIGEREIPAGPRAPHVWHEFARYVYHAGAAPTSVVSDEPSPEVLRIDGWAPLEEHGSTTRPSTQPTTRPPPMPLVHIAEGDTALSPLALSLRDNVFALKWSGGKLSDLPAELLLARWWVNGKPVAATKSPPIHRMQQQARLLREVEEIRVDFALPDFLGELKAGDRVGLQVLYSPDGWDPVSVGGAMQMQLQRMMRLRPKDGLTWPLVSNRIEFVLTDALLATRDHPIERN